MSEISPGASPTVDAPRFSATLLNRICLFLALAGVFVAGTLGLSHLLGITLPCGTAGGCETVANHPSSKWFGIPVAYMGFGAYVALAVLALLRAGRGESGRKFVLFGYAISGIGMLVSLGLTAYSITAIRATCDWCIASALIMTALFILHAMLIQNEGKIERGPLDLNMAAVLGVLVIGGLVAEASVLDKKMAVTTVTDQVLQETPKNVLLPADAHWMGSESAPITLIEFADLGCPTCKRAHAAVKELMAQHPGKIKHVFRHFPLYTSPDFALSLPTAIVAECAAEEGKFWEFIDAVFKDLDLKQANVEMVLDVAEGLGLDKEAIRPRLKKGSEAFNRVYADISTAHNLGIQAVPTFFVVAEGMSPRAAALPQLDKILKEPEYQKLLKE
jgi:protein-disulfide isomerase